MRASYINYMFRPSALKPEPSTYEWLQTIVATSATFIAPESNWYTFYIIGSGGNGGMGAYSYLSTGVQMVASGGSGASGSSGAWSKHKAFMKKNETAQITTTAGNEEHTSLTIAGLLIVAYNGAAGGDAIAPTSNTDQSVGGKAAYIPAPASGGNMSNEMGTYGINGANGTNTYGSSVNGATGASTSSIPSTYKYMNGNTKTGGAGGYGGSGEHVNPQNGKAGDSVTSGTETILGNPGSGGGGDGSYAGGVSKLSTARGSGGSGTSGGVVVEKGVS